LDTSRLEDSRAFHADRINVQKQWPPSQGWARVSNDNPDRKIFKALQSPTSKRPGFQSDTNTLVTPSVW
jgi:hypothetical protein